MQIKANECSQLRAEVEDLQSKLSLETYRSRAADHLQRDLDTAQSQLKIYKQVTRALATHKLPPLSQNAREQSRTILVWAESIQPGETFTTEVKEVVEALKKEFNNQLDHYGSSAKNKAATTDSDVDVMVLAGEKETEESMRSRLEKLPSFKVTSDRAARIPNLPIARMFHFRFKNIVGEVVWVTNQQEFQKSQKERAEDPLLNLEDLEWDALLALKRLRREAFGDIFPKSRILHHVVHTAFLEEKKRVANVELSSLVAASLRKLETLTAMNYDRYDRYTDVEWAVIKSISSYVRGHWQFEA